MEFNKCAFCENAVNKNGKLICYYELCIKSQRDIDKMIEKAIKAKGK